jgi:hypothetical protein
MRRQLTVLVGVGIVVVFAHLAAADTKAEPFSALAGEYYEGTSLYGTVLTLGPNGWFRFTTQRDNFDVPEKRCKGMFWEWQGTLIFKPTTTIKTREDWEAPPTRLVPVRWGKRRYLVREVHGQDFCNSVNLGDEPRTFWGAPYLRGEDFRIKVNGPPDVPERWRRYLLASPVYCKVTEVIPEAGYRIDSGSNAGLLVGMIVTKGSWLQDFSVESVEGETAVIKPAYAGSREVLTVGQALSSRRPK